MRIGVYFVSSFSKNLGGYSLDSPLFIWKRDLMWSGIVFIHKFLPPATGGGLQCDLEVSVKAQTFQGRLGKPYTEELVICRSGSDG